MTMDRALQRRPFGSWLLGTVDQGPRVLRVRVQLLLTVFLVSANLMGAAVTVVLSWFVLPGRPANHGVLVALAIAVPSYVLLATVIGAVWGTYRGLKVTRWINEGRTPTKKERTRTLRLPLQFTLIQGLLWAIATALFTTLLGILQPESIPRVLLTVAFGGLVTCADAYLLTEFALRPIADRAMAGGAGPPRRPLAAGLLTRGMLFWALGSGVPVLGLMVTAVFALTTTVSSARLAVTMLALGGCTLVFGGVLMWRTAKSVVAPVHSVRRALAVIEGGDLDVEVPVFDGTELGSLQAGFNRMAAGLRERERIRDLFGRYVGPDVAADALDRGVGLGGEERFAAVLFVDLVGSTQLAATRPPAEVVALLNRFLQIVIDEVGAHGGMVNKFAGDAALAVFGAPVGLPDPAGAALATARAIAGRLRAEQPPIAAGIGVAAGTVVAGTIGDERRYEYTVIGDPVNEAARLTELSKTYDARLLASMAAVDAAGEVERRLWSAGPAVELRGRAAPTPLALPAG
ncbi:MAG TPA: adenylate/guanylate cyclase domain-containing protein [Kribbellaceae bacterium]|nr:adenylate/guanylate cyclase domain-containing protein [Kribbellaceae bacterium]